MPGPPSGGLGSWWLLATTPDAAARPAELPAVGWRAAGSGAAPGTVAAVVGPHDDLDASDWWYRTTVTRDGGPAWLAFDGLATVAEIFVGGELVLGSESMWASHEIPLPAGAGTVELALAFRALTPRLAQHRRPRARWRTRTVADGELRWWRTMQLGRSPGFAPGPAVVGPWRPVRLLAAADPVRSLSLRSRLDGNDGVVSVALVPRGDRRGREVWTVAAPASGAAATVLEAGADGTLRGELRVPGPALWWPHTHGTPHLHELAIRRDGLPVARRRVGFRTLAGGDDVRGAGLALTVNGVEIFCRGAVWTPTDLLAPHAGEARLRPLLSAARDAGMNMLRVTGVGAYESDDFHALCDELGLLVWQDLMFANLDYPFADEAFRAAAEAEVARELDRLGGHPSLAVLCGNSEVEQTPAMAGLDPALGRHAFFDTWVPAEARAARLDAVYVPSTPCGGTVPFRANAGVTHYFGVSGYFRPLADARAAEVRFASECLAFANVPDDVTAPVHSPAWKAGVIRDAGTGWDLGAGWDFDDVRDHYLRELTGLDPVELRRVDHARYLELGRLVTGEVIARTLGEWRRAGSPCRGALVLWLKDLRSGAGFGLLDAGGTPKVAWRHAARAMAPRAVWLTDEGVNGVHVHLANDPDIALRARLRVALWRDGGTVVAEASEEIDLPPHTTVTRDVEAMTGWFIDAAWAYRFGPPNHHAIFATLDRPEAPHRPLSVATLFPAGLPLAQESAGRLGLTAELAGGPHAAVLRLRADRVVIGLRVAGDGVRPAEDAFHLEPGRPREVALARAGAAGGPTLSVTVTATNLSSPVRVTGTGREA